jgi:serine/threonine-protein kinase RsbW
MELQLDFKADINNIAPVVQRISDLATELGCEPGRELQIALALQEALANAVIHGSKNDPSKTVECRVSYADPAANAHSPEIVIIIRDAGIGFDPGEVPSPRSGENVRADHGRGIYLVRELMDEVSFACNGTELRMRAVLSALR